MPTLQPLAPCLTVHTWDPEEVPFSAVTEGRGGGQWPRAPCTCPKPGSIDTPFLGPNPLSVCTLRWLVLGREGAYLDTDPVQ